MAQTQILDIALINQLLEIKDEIVDYRLDHYKLSGDILYIYLNCSTRIYIGSKAKNAFDFLEGLKGK